MKYKNHIEGFFRTEKGMEVQSSKTTEGYVMQASQPKDGWKTLTGMRLAVAVQILHREAHSAPNADKNFKKGLLNYERTHT